MFNIDHTTSQCHKLKVMSPSTLNGMSNGDIKKINIETLAKVSDYLKNDVRELYVTIIEDEENAE